MNLVRLMGGKLSDSNVRPPEIIESKMKKPSKLDGFFL